MSTVFGSDRQIDSAIDGYAEFSTDALRSQIFFEKFRRYKSSSYAEASERYYHNELVRSLYGKLGFKPTKDGEPGRWWSLAIGSSRPQPLKTFILSNHADLTS